MENDLIIISERNRPYYQTILSALLFTAAVAYFIFYVYNAYWSDNTIRAIGYNFEVVIYLFGAGVAFSFQKSIYINLKALQFRSTFEIGPIKLGKWKTVPNPQYVSIFKQPLVDGNHIFEVNLWYQKNKHWELYEKHDYVEAYKIGFELAEELNIDLLDATTPNNFKWVDKLATHKTGKIVYQD